MRLIDITGQRFGRLRVIRKHREPSKNGGSFWDCLCDCGTAKTVNSSNLRNGSIVSCGCFHREDAGRRMAERHSAVRKAAATREVHGHKPRSGASLEYKIWIRIKSRCDNPKNKDWP